MNTWLRPLQALEDGATLRLYAPNRFAVDWVQAAIPNKHLFLLALCLFLFVAAALMEIYAAIVVLVPLLLPLTRSYGIDPLHFGIILIAAVDDIVATFARDRHRVSVDMNEVVQAVPGHFSDIVEVNKFFEI